MVSKNILLMNLPPFLNNRNVIMENQNVGDIINGILSTHQQYKDQYDKISSYFLGKDLEDTCYNVWKFLKDNVPYRIESDNFQTLRSPSSIVSGIPADCKTYSIFSCGILDSLRRKKFINCKLAYRFAGYNSFSDNLEHVFCVVNPKSKNEIWVDAVLPNFNEKKQPSIFKDKNINMALVALSGIGQNLPMAPQSLQYSQPAISQSMLAQPKKDLFSFQNISETAASLTNPISAGLKAIETLSALFANKPNPNDWVGWDEQDRQAGRTQGSTTRGYILGDGDSVQNEALNIVSYIKSKGLDVLIKGNPSGNYGDTRVAKDGISWRDVTIDEIVDKLSRGGYAQEAKAIKDSYYSLSNILPTGPEAATKTAGMNIWVTLALVGAGIYAISKMKK